MGTIVAKSAAREDIEADIAETIETAQTRGAPWQAGADQILRPTHDLIQHNLARLAAAELQRSQAERVAEAADASADDRTADAHDRYYNAIGRPGVNSDPVYSLIFPHASGGIRNVARAEQPVLMGVVVELLREHVHPLVDPAFSDTLAAEIEAAATALATAEAAVTAAEVRVTQLRRTAVVLARLGQIQLSRLKKHWKSLGRSEADIHEIIPDRSPPKVKPAAPEATSSGEDDASPEASAAK